MDTDDRSGDEEDMHETDDTSGSDDAADGGAFLRAQRPFESCFS